MIYFWQGKKHVVRSFCSALVFYSIIPLPQSWTVDWSRIARWASFIGLLLGFLLGLGDIFFQYCQIPDLTRSAMM